MSDSKDLMVPQGTQGIIAPATEDSLNSLHQVVAQYFLNIISKTNANDIDPKIIDQILRFLKDNNIKASPTYNRDLKALQSSLGISDLAADSLPFDIGEDDEDN